MAPPPWDAVVAQSRPWLPSLFRAVLSEVSGFGHKIATFADRHHQLLGSLLKAYTIGVFDSEEIEVDSRRKEEQSAEPSPVSAAELRQFRRAHSEVLTHCLARVHCLAWQIIRRGGLGDTSAEALAQIGQHYWHHSLAEARKRIEWAVFSDSLN